MQTEKRCLTSGQSNGKQVWLLHFPLQALNHLSLKNDTSKKAAEPLPVQIHLSLATRTPFNCTSEQKLHFYYVHFITPFGSLDEQLLGQSNCAPTSYLPTSTFTILWGFLNGSTLLRLSCVLSSCPSTEWSNHLFHKNFCSIPPTQHSALLFILHLLASLINICLALLHQIQRHFTNLILWYQRISFLSLLVFLWQAIHLCHMPSGTRDYVKWTVEFNWLIYSTSSAVTGRVRLRRSYFP